IGLDSARGPFPLDEVSTAVCALCPGSQERWKATVSTRNFTLHVRQLVTGTPANLTQHWVRYLRRLVRQTYAGVQAKHISQLAARACHITLLYRSSRFSSHSPQPSRLCLYQTYSTRSSRSWPSSSHRIVWVWFAPF